MTITAKIAMMIEIWHIRQLTSTEMDDLARYMREWLWTRHKLRELSITVQRLKDWDWLHELCRRLDELAGG
ncbi:hypothetical protein GCM10011571_32960 [Marinithermofilum abyssi]|uniref:Uncharacterized protein n=1 Tax=Marinithermofilum abyssi TaxID=1571185 RepID=A0A8J2VKH3_9BACL|nr:hypothetical protein GCM10011571_32960 [Marinithermofilum abyssi]